MGNDDVIKSKCKNESKVVIGDFPTKLDIPPDRVLKAAFGKLSQVLIIGIDLEGHAYYASSYADKGAAMFNVELFKQFLLETRPDA